MKIKNNEGNEKIIKKKLFYTISKKCHSKHSIDNIMKKVRVHLFKYLVFSINKILKKDSSIKKRLSNLNYVFVSQLRKKDNLRDLDDSINNLLSKNPKNKIIIEDIIKKNINNEKINDIFNLTFREWIYIFTMEKEPTIEEIQFDGFYSFLEEILDKNKDEESYFVNFIFCLYNFEKWFISKKKRSPKIKLQKKNQ